MMERVVVVGGRQGWPAVTETPEFRVRFVRELADPTLVADADCVAVLPTDPLELAAAVASVEDARRANAVAMVLCGAATPDNARLLATHEFDAFVDVAWPPDVARACVQNAIRQAQSGRNVVQIQREVLQHTRSENESLFEMASHDDLTGLFNRRHFLDAMQREHDRCRRQERSYGVVFIDLDDLKRLNSRQGHAGGSMALREIGRILAASLRGSDVAGRIGGDEFVVLLADCDRSGAQLFAERLRQRVADRPLRINGNTVTVTASMGVSAYPEDGRDSDEVLDRADAALFRAKSSGKNCTAMLDPLVRP